MNPVQHAALTSDQLVEMEAAARHGIGVYLRHNDPDGILECRPMPGDTSAVYLRCKRRSHVEGVKFGLWSAWYSAVEVPHPFGASDGVSLIVERRFDRDPATEDWQPGDLVLAADRFVWMRASRSYWPEEPWAFTNGRVYSPDAHGELWDELPSGHRLAAPSGHREEAAPLGPLMLLVRDGKPVAAGGAR